MGKLYGIILYKNKVNKFNFNLVTIKNKYHKHIVRLNYFLIYQN